jgi:glycerophosphoryl diester phosphodiesterase
MKIIAHRANIGGPSSVHENTLLAAESALERGFDIELDVWKIGNDLVLSHDLPQSRKDVANEFLISSKRVWWHAKNIEALEELTTLGLHVFWHDKDDYALTSNGFIWTQLGKNLTVRSVVVLPEVSKQPVPDWVAAVCTDFPELYTGSLL